MGKLFGETLPDLVDLCAVEINSLSPLFLRVSPPVDSLPDLKYNRLSQVASGCFENIVRGLIFHLLSKLSRLMHLTFNKRNFFSSIH